MLRKKVINTIIFNSLTATPLSVTSISYSFTLSEIGSIIPTSSVINFQYIDNESMFILDIELLDNNIVVLADDYFGVKIVDCSNPELLILIDSYEHQWRTLWGVESKKEKITKKKF